MKVDLRATNAVAQLDVEYDRDSGLYRPRDVNLGNDGTMLFWLERGQAYHLHYSADSADMWCPLGGWIVTSGQLPEGHTFRLAKVKGDEKWPVGWLPVQPGRRMTLDGDRRYMIAEAVPGGSWRLYDVS